MQRMWPSQSSFFKTGDFRPCKESQELTSETLQILKEKDVYQFTVEIKQTAKGDAQVSVKTRSDATAKEAGDMALAEYKRILGELKK